MVHYSHLMYLDLNSEMTHFDRQYKISVTDLLLTYQSLFSVARTDCNQILLVWSGGRCDH